MKFTYVNYFLLIFKRNLHIIITGIASCSLVGNALGSGKKGLAINISHIALASIIVIDLAIGLIIIQFGGYYVRIFTDDKDVLYHSDKLLPFLAMFAVFDGIQGCGFFPTFLPVSFCFFF